MGEALANKLERELGVGRPADYDIELMRLRRVYGLPEDFETRLVALCRRPEDERKVRDKISEWYGIRHPSIIAYELIAHLIKHRYLDAIISFNYDELLDQSLDDELGRTEYVRVLSERDCHSIKSNPDQPGYVPLYIKMHGTASEPESLRFTRESYYWTPKPIIGVVEQLLNTENLVVMNLGCRLASFDFQYLLREPRNVSLFHLNPEPLDDRVRLAIDELRGKDKAPIESIFCGGSIDGGKDFLPVAFGRLVKSLKHEVKSETAGLASWRPVGRHRAASRLLDVDLLGAGKHNTEYLRQRTVLEVAFAAAKGRGVVSTTSLIDERCGHYYDLYVSAAERERAVAATWPTLCAAGGLIESDDSSDVYYADQDVCVRGELPAPTREDPATNHTLRSIDERLLASRVLAEIDSSKWSTHALSPALRSQKRHLASVIEKLSTKDELEIHSLDDRVCSKVFVDPLILPTHTAFHGWSRELLVGDDYDEILVVAETGGWLAKAGTLQQLEVLGEGMVKLIAAFDMRAALLDESLGDIVDMRCIPWWRHNRHMRLLCKGGQPLRAIYYARHLRTSMVTPVFLQHGADLKRLKLGWDRLWQEAEDHEARLALRAAKDATNLRTRITGPKALEQA
jgi:SIR2-like domain